MKRDDLVTIGLQGADGKPQSVLAVQFDLFAKNPSAIPWGATRELRSASFFEGVEQSRSKTVLPLQPESLASKALKNLA